MIHTSDDYAVVIEPVPAETPVMGATSDEKVLDIRKGI